MRNGMRGNKVSRYNKFEYLSMQARSEIANALQIFDSWVGAVNADQYKPKVFILIWNGLLRL